MSANALLQHRSARNPNVYMRCNKYGSVGVVVVESEGEGSDALVKHKHFAAAQYATHSSVHPLCEEYISAGCGCG